MKGANDKPFIYLQYSTVYSTTRLLTVFLMFMHYSFIFTISVYFVKSKISMNKVLSVLCLLFITQQEEQPQPFLRRKTELLDSTESRDIRISCINVDLVVRADC